MLAIFKLRMWTATAIVFPDHCRQAGQELVTITAKEVLDETGLKQARFTPAMTDESYISPETENSVWKKPGPKSGPF
jgi:hypothetical protein